MPNFIDEIKMNGTTVIDENGNVVVGTSVKFANGEYIADGNGNELVKFTTTAAAVNEITIANNSTGAAPTISATGETNVPLTIAAKGTGKISLGQATSTGVQLVADQPILDSAGNELVKFVKTTTAVNEVTITNNSTGLGPTLTATGETNVPITLAGKGTGKVSLGQATSIGIGLVADQPILDSSDNELIKFVKTATAVNEITVTNAATGNAPSITATGETNVGLTISAKGTGVVTINDADILKEGTVATHDYEAGTTAWTLSAAEKIATQLICTNAGGGADIIAPSENRIYWIYNNSGQNITIKKTAGTGFAVATGKYAGAYYNGSDYARLTPDL